MKKRIIYIGLLLSLLVISCTKNFNDINIPTNGLPSNNNNGTGGGNTNAQQLPTPAILQTMMRALYGGYQVEQGLCADIFSGYMGTATNFMGNNQNQVYFLVDNYNAQMFGNWTTVMNNFIIIDTLTRKNPTDTNKAVFGMAFVVNVLVTQWAADYYGTLPYTTFGNPNGSAYQSQKMVYDTMFSRLDSAIKYLDPIKTSTTGIDNTADLFYAGNQKQWVQLAHSLRLRLAMRIVNIDPNTAKNQVTKAITLAANTGGLLINNTDNATIHSNLYTNELWTICHSWTDSRLAADMMCFLLGYKDPRLPIYADTVDTKTQYLQDAGQKYAGVRVGTILVAKIPFFYSPLGSYASKNRINPTYEQSPLPFFVAAETYFLLAEAALRGWINTNTPQQYYETGITTSMNQWNINDPNTINTYLNATNTQADFIDPTTPDANIKAVSTCIPQWNNAANSQNKLEQIITQKWLATFPGGGPNAWAEYRRTGFPVLFPPYFSVVFPTISFNGKQVNAARKLRIPLNEYNNNSVNVNNAVNTFFAGKDAITTRVWWDVDPQPIP